MLTEIDSYDSSNLANLAWYDIWYSNLACTGSMYGSVLTTEENLPSNSFHILAQYVTSRSSKAKGIFQMRP
jgi:hypothetical protein